MSKPVCICVVLMWRCQAQWKDEVSQQLQVIQVEGSSYKKVEDDLIQKRREELRSARALTKKPFIEFWQRWKAGLNKHTYRKIMHAQNTQNHITGNDLVQIEWKSFYND